MTAESQALYVLCVENEGYEASLEKRKVYRRVADASVGDEPLIRVIDESGESYLFPSAFFVSVIIPEAASFVFEEVNA